ncbi:hypothetical protein BDV98DRAFT_573741 [Pterulicium gracile]|uniref:Uncharacterized protein n=1 Tax=Pterulicium gracile TaxID=1884261 RepID=A0A5C3Q7B8_9AGAR|nr:hypothetical protein BDV98DRAFT_573741 [Pterula gracilis]
MSNKTPSGGPHIAIIGAGLGGITTAIQLKRKYGYQNFTIYEKAAGVGGTWRDNVYPGAASDIHIHLYTLSTDLDHTFNHSHGTSPEIRAYWDRLTTKYDIYPHIVFNAKILSADWNAEENAYTIVTVDVCTCKETLDRITLESEGVRTTHKANIIISAQGILEIPNTPDIDGLRDFKGQIFHSARWDSSVELKEKRVCVIGNGSSSAQFVPLIVKDPAVHVTQFIRTPSWFKVAPWGNYSPRWRRFFFWFPVFMRLKRWALWTMGETAWFFIRWKLVNRLLLRRAFGDSIRQFAPKKYHEKLIPDYAPGCKRIISDRDGMYLKCLNQPNIELNFDGIKKIVEGGVITRTDEFLPADVIITATGYTTNTFPIALRGRTGKTVEEYYDSHNGAQAYHGTTVPGFPNFCMISGPNTVTGHNSVIYSTEVQVDYIMKLLRPLLQGKVAAFDVKDEATEAYNNRLQYWLSNSIYSGCVSWYRIQKPGQRSPPTPSPDGQRVRPDPNSAGKPNIFPGPLIVMQWWMRRPIWTDYDVFGQGAEKWKNGVLLRRRLRGVFIVLGLVAAAYVGCDPYGVFKVLQADIVHRFSWYLS